MTQTKAKSPDLIAYHVANGRDGGKAFFTRIGAAWKTESGKGFNLRLDLIPVDGSTITLLPYEPRADEAAG
jgi:hypothetical protein